MFRAMAPAQNASPLTSVSSQSSGGLPGSSLSGTVGGVRGAALDPPSSQYSYSQYPPYQSPVGGEGMGGGVQYQLSGGSGGGAQYPPSGSGEAGRGVQYLPTGGEGTRGAPYLPSGGGGGGARGGAQYGSGGAAGGAFYNQRPAHQPPTNGGSGAGPSQNPIYENLGMCNCRNN